MRSAFTLTMILGLTGAALAQSAGARTPEERRLILEAIGKRQQQTGTTSGELFAKQKQAEKAAAAEKKSRDYAKNHRSAVVATKVALRKMKAAPKQPVYQDAIWW